MDTPENPAPDTAHGRAWSAVALAEFDREIGLTRRVLACVPEERFGPGEGTEARLVARVTAAVVWLPVVLASTPAESSPEGPAAHATRGAALDAFDAAAATARRALLLCSDAELLAPWTLTRDGQALFSAPRATMLRLQSLNPMIHFRARLAALLAATGVALPPMYAQLDREETPR